MVQRALRKIVPSTLESAGDVLLLLLLLTLAFALVVSVAPVGVLAVISAINLELPRSASTIGLSLSAIAQSLAAILGFAIAFTVVLVQVFARDRPGHLETFMHQRLIVIIPFLYLAIILVSLAQVALLETPVVSEWQVGTFWTIIALVLLAFVLLALYLVQVIDFLIPVRLVRRMTQQILKTLSR